MPYTSGTTGQPKGILRKKKKWADVTTESPVFVNRALGIKVGSVALMSAPLHHSATNTFVQNALLYGDTLILLEKFDAETVLQIIEKHKVPILITSLGNPSDVVTQVHSWGGQDFHDVTTLRHAQKAIDAGVDGLILVCNGVGELSEAEHY